MELSGRMALGFGLACVVFELIASAMYYAASGPAAGFGDDPGALLKSNQAALIRSGSLVDMFGYLAALPVAVYWRRRFPFGTWGDVFAAAGVAFVVVGAIGAVLMATAAPPLMSAYATGSAIQRAQLTPAFETLYRGVVLGMWQTLETIPLAVWLIGSSIAARRYRERTLFLVLLVLGAANALVALYRLVA